MSLHHCEANGKLDRLRPKKAHHDPCAFSFDVHTAERMKARACAGIDEALLSAFSFEHLAEARERRFYKWLDVQDVRHVRRRSMFTTPTCSSPQLGVSVHILVEEISEPAWPACIARLRTESPKPHVIACFDFHPVLVQTIHGLAFQNVKTVLHHVGLGEGDQGTGLEGYDSHMHVVAQVHRIYEASCGPSAFGVWHGRGYDVAFVDNERVRRAETIDR